MMNAMPDAITPGRVAAQRVRVVHEAVVGQDAEAGVEHETEAEVAVTQDVGAVDAEVALAVHRWTEEMQVHAAMRQRRGRDLCLGESRKDQ